MLTVLTIVLCIIGPVLWALYVQRNARRRLATRELPDLPYETEGRYVVGGRYGSNPVTGAIGYDRWPFLDEGTATYMTRWLNNGDDHRSLAMVFWAYEQLTAKSDAEARQAALQAVHDDGCPTCADCSCAECQHDFDYYYTHEVDKRIVATYQVPGPILGDVVRYVPGLETGYRSDSVVVCACGTYLRRGTKASKRGTCDACDYRLTFGITNIRAAATRFTVSSGPR